MHIEKEHQDMIKAEIEQGLIGCPKWNVVNKLPMPHQPMTQQIKDPYAKGVKKEQTNHLEKEQWEPVYTVLARTIQDGVVVGKEPFNYYFKAVKPEHKGVGFDGTKADFKVIA